MTDYFHGDEDEDDPTQLADDTELVVIDRDRRGLPCFGCYFTALFESFGDEQLDTIEVGAEVPAEVAEHSRRAGATFSVIADGVAFIVSDLAGDDAIAIAESICQRIMQATMLHAAPVQGRPN